MRMRCCVHEAQVAREAAGPQQRILGVRMRTVEPSGSLPLIWPPS